MTAIAAHTAEAIASAMNIVGGAHGPRAVYLQPKISFENSFFGIATSVDSADCSLDGFEPDGRIYVRKDVVDAALAHLATRAAEAEGRAERAEAALIRVVEVGDGVGFDVAVKALREAGLMDPEDDDEEDTAHE